MCHRITLCQAWANETNRSFELQTAKVDGREVVYPLLLDAVGEPMLVEHTNDFLIWFCAHADIVTKRTVVEKALSWLKACGDMARSKFSLPVFDKGVFSSHLPVQVAINDHTKAAGSASIAAGNEVALRADNILTFDQMTAMMHRCYAADPIIHDNPLRCIQTGGEVRITHQSGPRGQVVRSAKFEHVWLRAYDELADSEGINGVTLYNNRGDKTHSIGEGSHYGWVPNSNVLLCPSVALGTAMLYRYVARRESFPDVCAKEPTTGCVGFQYKWLPLFITTAHNQHTDLDPSSGQLSIRGLSDDYQNICFHKLYTAAGIPRVSGDAVTHVGRAQCQQEAQNSGVNSREVEEALGYEDSAKKSTCYHSPTFIVSLLRAFSRLTFSDHYTPQIPLSFQLQRGSLPWLPEQRSYVDAVQFRILREHGCDVVYPLLDFAVSKLPEQDAVVAAIPDLPDDPYSAKDGAERRRANKESHKREHQRFLDFSREVMSLALIGAALRPRNRKKEIMYDSPSMIDLHGKQPLYKAMRVARRADGDLWLFDHPLFIRLKEIAKQAEQDDKIAISAAEQKAAKAHAAAVAAELDPKLQAAAEAGKAAWSMANSLPTLVGKVSQCEVCLSPPPVGGMALWMPCCVDITQESFQGHSGGCYCRAVFSAGNSYCRMLADALRFRDIRKFNRIVERMGQPFCQQHAKCVDEVGFTLLHLAVYLMTDEHFDIGIVEMVLDWGTPMEAMAKGIGTALCLLFELSSENVVRMCELKLKVVRLLILRGADYTSPCTPGGKQTPLEVFLGHGGNCRCGKDSCPQCAIACLLRDGIPAPPNPSSSCDADPPETVKKQKLTKDSGGGLPQMAFQAFERSIHKLWDEYFTLLRPRFALDEHWLGQGPESHQNRLYYGRKELYYRRIAQEYEKLKDLSGAVDAVQQWAAPYFAKGGGGWDKMDDILRKEVPAGEERDRLNKLVARLR